MLLFRVFMSVAATFGSMSAAATCPGLPAGALPVMVGALQISAVPGPGSTVGTPPVIFFSGTSVVVKQAAGTEALEITFQTGSAGPVDASQRDAAGRVLRTDILLTTATPTGQITHYYYTRGAHDVVFTSRNNEGALIAVCEARSLIADKAADVRN